MDLVWPACCDARDLGGLPTPGGEARRGWLFRSSLRAEAAPWHDGRPAAAPAALLAHLAGAYGGAAGYLRRAGVGPSAVDTLRARLVTAASAC